MPNESGPPPRIGAFGENKPLSAEQLRNIVATLATRIIGDNKFIKVRSFPGGQILIEGIGGGNSGGVSAPAGVKRVPKLPAIPESGMLEVFWYGFQAPPLQSGTGDNQIWRVYAGQTRWTPTQKATNFSGLPTP